MLKNDSLTFDPTLKMAANTALMTVNKLYFHCKLFCRANSTEAVRKRDPMNNDSLKICAEEVKWRISLFFFFFF